MRSRRATGRRYLDVLDGSPPCQAFSTAGPRDRTWGREVAHADGTTQRSDDLFFEYARILGETMPSAFVAENVSGLVKGVARGYFKQILAALAGRRLPRRGAPPRRAVAGRAADAPARDLHGRARGPRREDRRRPAVPGAAGLPLPAERRLPRHRAPRGARLRQGHGRRRPAPALAHGRRLGLLLLLRRLRPRATRTAPRASSPSRSSRPSARSRPTTSCPAPTRRPGRASATACRRS